MRILLLLLLGGAAAQNLDQFTYDDTRLTSPNNVYPPPQWGQVRCADLNTCLGYPNTFPNAAGWQIEGNTCQWCPAERDSACSNAHRQSPINMERRVAIVGDAMENPCIDVHWMQYHDSTCSFEELQRLNAFTVERYALKVAQPLESLGNDQYQLACKNDRGQSRAGVIDFSRGYSQWYDVAWSSAWHLSSIEFHVPSEHTQEGHRYSGELHMYHVYSATEQEAGVANQLGTVTIFLEAYNETQDWPELNKLICQWRLAEERTRDQCGLPSVVDEYPGCFYYQRGFGTNATSPQTSEHDESRHLRSKMASTPKPLTLHDVFINAESSSKPKLRVHKEDLKERELDWDEFIADVYHREAEAEHGRRLLNYDHVGWFNYFPMIAVKTEYYYRYSGTTTIPPCYGPLQQGTRAGINAWRVMKDPIRISLRQLNEMHRLLKSRIAPVDDPVRPCEADSAAKEDPDDPSKVIVARPLQSKRPAHYETFCECVNWKSKWIEDQEWCRKEQMERFYDQPYNFEHAGY